MLLGISILAIAFATWAYRTAAITRPFRHVESIGGLVLHTWNQPKIKSSVCTSTLRAPERFVFSCVQGAQPSSETLDDPRKTVAAIVVPASSIQLLDISMIRQLPKLHTIVIHSFIELPLTGTDAPVEEAKRRAATAVSLKRKLANIRIVSADLSFHSDLGVVSVQRVLYDSWKAIAKERHETTLAHSP